MLKFIYRFVKLQFVIAPVVGKFVMGSADQFMQSPSFAIYLSFYSVVTCTGFMCLFYALVQRPLLDSVRYIYYIITQ